jgi:magnesium-transporting ATPase (P-type)
MIILFLGPSIFDVDPGWESDDWSEDNAKHFTILFDTFVMFQLFNEINCRKVQMNEVNVFKNFFNNWMFHFIFILTFIVQIVFVQFGGEFMGCSGLNFWQHLTCIGIGACALVFEVCVRFTVSNYRAQRDKKNRKNENYKEYRSLLNSSSL